MKNIIFLTFIFILTLLTGCEQHGIEKKDTDSKSHENIEAEAEAEAEKPKDLKQIILTLGSWRKDDVEQINYILSKFTDKYPHIVIKFDPTSPSDYNEVIEAQLESGTAPDLFYLRSFSHSRKLYEAGYLFKLNSLPGIREQFPASMLKAWSTSEGDIYGVPLMAVSHGIYYNKSFFEKENIPIPQTWEELLAIAERIKKMGIVPFANTTGDAWTINGLILQNVIPSIIGGADGRLAYYNGQRCFNDEQMIASFQAVKDISAYISSNHKLLKYADSLQLFAQGRSPMLFGGSWDIPFFEERNLDFEWSVFVIPPPAGKECFVTFHPDSGIGLNRSSPYIEEAKLFLQWMTTADFASLVVEQLPGYFPMQNDVISTKNKYAALFLSFNDKYKTDMRFVWGKIRDGSPSAYELSLQSCIDIMNGVMTPVQAADNLQRGLSQWYTPATQCSDNQNGSTQ
ncbi:ABC transporter substrate-binding protein [Maridesulfovibrio zosterae]|uniref:ABC transporter substrate-binding protein n=1 Tax=Maridesulfovibrio zosterae TaxID=82171 RepID=UPI0003FF95A9|nr:extracellular solute-binding protein [Maridesulfovibrio zosterae]